VKPAGRWGHLRAGGGRAALLASLWGAAGSGWPQTEGVPSPDAAVVQEQRRLQTCAQLSRIGWPASTSERRALLVRLDSTRQACLDQPDFLAALGGLWLEEGDVVQALLWLERALLLAPEHRGARADHALALAAAGEPAALEDLRKEWAARTDLPDLLRQRLDQAARLTAANRQPASRPDAEAGGRWLRLSELGLFFGYESNLDRSPKLDELTITPPDGPVSLPLDKPLRPRPGTALSYDASWQAAYQPDGLTLLRGGVQLNGRASPEHPSTDWHSVQAAASVSRRWGRWRTEALASVTEIGGQLNEAYRLTRLGLSVDTQAMGCQHRLAADAEQRRQAVSILANSRTLGGTWYTQCPLPFMPGWVAGVALRALTDQPADPERAGGVQRQASVGLRIGAPLGRFGRWEATARVARSLDADGYSPLLGNNARRWLKPAQLGLEATVPAAWLGWNGWNGSELIAQLQATHQSSNLPVFVYRSHGIFLGVRNRW
jgi:hypothetical protein